MTQIKEITKSGFCPMHVYKGWKTAFMTCIPDDDPAEYKRHLLTDETFILIKGKASVLTYDGGEVSKTEMCAEKLYVVPENTWHRVDMSRDALLFVVESSDTSRDNTERMVLDDHVRND